MPLVDLSLLVTYIIALGIVALPVEAGILVLVNNIRRTITSPEKRAELLREGAAQLWEPFKDPEQRKGLVHELAAEVWSPLATAELRQKVISELGHGLIRVVKENEGSLKGIAVRQARSEILELAKSGGANVNVLTQLGKIKLPVVGEVTIPEALQLFGQFRELLSGRGLLTQAPPGAINITPGTGGGYPP
jgi:hypothetical protein